MPSSALARESTKLWRSNRSSTTGRLSMLSARRNVSQNMAALALCDGGVAEVAHAPVPRWRGADRSQSFSDNRTSRLPLASDSLIYSHNALSPTRPCPPLLCLHPRSLAQTARENVYRRPRTTPPTDPSSHRFPEGTARQARVSSEPSRARSSVRFAARVLAKAA